MVNNYNNYIQMYIDQIWDKQINKIKHIKMMVNKYNQMIMVYNEINMIYYVFFYDFIKLI